MARVYGDFLKGIVGPVSLKVLNGIQVVSQRMWPGTMNQTVNTKKTANTFGVASSLACNVREVFQNQINGFADSGMVNRLNSRMTGILNICRDPESRLYNFEEDSFNQLTGFDFNMNSPLFKALRIVPDINFNEGILSITAPPAKVPAKLKFIARSTNCEVIASVGWFRLEEGEKTYSTIDQSIVVKRELPNLDQLSFKFDIPNGCLCIVSIFLKYYLRVGKREVILNSKKYSPAGICAALLIPGKYEERDKQIWVGMNKLEFAV